MSTGFFRSSFLDAAGAAVPLIGLLVCSDPPLVAWADENCYKLLRFFCFEACVHLVTILLLYVCILFSRKILYVFLWLWMTVFLCD